MSYFVKWIFIHPSKKYLLSSQFDLDTPLNTEEIKIYKKIPTTKFFNLVKGIKRNWTSSNKKKLGRVQTWAHKMQI